MTTIGGVRVPSGRAGRLWLERRLRAAEHAEDLLEQKLRILHREEQRLVALTAETDAEWRRRCEDADTWMLRAALLSGRRGLRLAAHGVSASVEVTTVTTMGVVHPAAGTVRVDVPPAGPPPGSAALVAAERAGVRAVEAALAAAVAAAALRAIRAEVAGTRRTLRAVQQRWVPRLSEALGQVRLDLDELEHAEGVRHRWAAERQGR